MALINTDWEKELNQVERRIITLLDEKVEPLLDRAISKTSTEMSTVVSQATFELQDVTTTLMNDLREQRKEFISDLKSVIRYAAIMAFTVVVASVIVVAVARNF